MECGRTIEGHDGRNLYLYMIQQYEYLGDLASNKVKQTDPTRKLLMATDKEKLKAMKANIKVFPRMHYLQIFELRQYMIDHVENNEDLRKTFLTRDPSDISLENAEKRLKRTVLTREKTRKEPRSL